MLGEATRLPTAGSFGARLRALRLQRGLSQEQVGAGSVSASYVSLLESGHRVPSQRVIASLAARLSVSIDQLAGGAATIEAAGRVDLALARSALAARRFEQALPLADRALASGPVSLRDDELFDAALVRARALVGCGNPGRAVLPLTGLARQAERLPVYYPLLPVLDALCVASWNAGDAAATAAAGTALEAEMSRLGIPASACPDAAFASIAAAWTAGDDDRARGLLEQPEQSARDRAEALAAQAHAARSQGAYVDANVLTELAAASVQTQEADTARLLLAEANRTLRRVPATAADARRLLLPVVASLPGAPPAAQAARARLALARCETAAGRAARGRRLALRVLRASAGTDGIEQATAFAVVAEAALALGQPAQGRAALGQASRVLEASGRGRLAAEAWVMVADQLDSHGETAAAGRAYRRALGCAGLAQARTAEPDVCA